jgi:hypothetical protein
MQFKAPALPNIPGITDTQTPDGAFAPPAPPAATVSDAVYTQTAQTAAQDAAAAPAPAEATKPKAKRTSQRKVSAENTAAGAGAQAGKFELPELLAMRVEKLNAANPNDERLLFLRALQATGVAFGTVDLALGHVQGAASDFLGAEAAPTQGALKMYGNVMLALGKLYQVGLLPAIADTHHQALLLLALNVVNLESNLAVARDQLVARENAGQDIAQALGQASILAQQHVAQPQQPQFHPQPQPQPQFHPQPQPQFQPAQQQQPMAFPGQPLVPQQMMPQTPSVQGGMTMDQLTQYQAWMQQQQQIMSGGHPSPAAGYAPPGLAGAQLPPGFTPPFAG